MLRSNLMRIGYAAAAGLLLSLLARHGMERWHGGSSQNPSIIAGAALLLVLVAAAAASFRPGGRRWWTRTKRCSRSS